MRWIWIWIGMWSALWAAEEQGHGILFERQVVDQLLGRGYTSEWDIPGEGNVHRPGVPVSVKFIRWGNAVYLGDALRQRKVAETFQMVVGFYEPKGDRALVQAVHLVELTAEDWEKLWGRITVVELEAFNREIEKGSIEEARTLAKKRAAALRAKSPVMSIHPKINKDQRRIQCSISFKRFHREFLKQDEPQPQKELKLWGRPFPEEIELGARSRRSGS